MTLRPGLSDDMLRACLPGLVGQAWLTHWERGFVISLLGKHRDGRCVLSERQRRLLAPLARRLLDQLHSDPGGEAFDVVERAPRLI